MTVIIEHTRKVWNNNLSIIMIGVNILLLLIYFGSSPSEGGDQLTYSVASIVFVTLQIGGYTLTYKSSKWPFAIFILITILVLLGYTYLIGMGHAFQH
ncbi:hypothetical protein H7F33_08855 [Pedobacter sp. PAMC26386]|nr:hypothetical protein H7F33_08855 [Pedobacter sp. PAMC26386]